jgi:signal transduction histidine kinase
MEDALRLKKSLRIILLGSVMIFLPSMLLAYFGISSIQGEELAVFKDVKNQADGAANAFRNQFERPLASFESSVTHRLAAGRSPLEAPQELHPGVLVALKLDAGLQLVAPFRAGSPLSEPVDFLFDPSVRRALAADRRLEADQVVSQLYAHAEDASRSAQVKARMRFDRARLAARAGRPNASAMLMAGVIRDFGDLRDPWGFRMEDLVELYRAEGLMERNPLDGAQLLRTLVDRLMDRRWAIGMGGEGAVARRALSLLGPFADSEWVAATRERIDVRMGLLYWAEELLPELDALLAGGRNFSVDKGKMRWVEGERGLWALNWWGDDLYAFALDRTQLIADARRLAEEVSPVSSPVVGMLFAADEDVPTDVLSRRSLVPWMLGWSMAVVPRDAQALKDDLQSRRDRRIGIIILAISLIGLGALSTGRLVRTELDAARVKTDFAANVSHELRSPITQIRLKAESLMLGLSDTPEEQARDYRIIVRESERLSRLVDNVLDYSAIERGAKTYAMVVGDLGETVASAIETVEGSAELVDRDLYISIKPDLPAVAHDNDAIAQCVINLLSNAAKYSEPEDPIRLVMRRQDDGVVVAVTDEGIGIPQTDVEQIFEPFFRGSDASVRRRKGTGIGLAITFYIVSAHNGTVDVVSKPGEGSTFSLWFPAMTGDSTQRQGA